MIFAIVIIPIAVTVIWLTTIRPYCQRNRKGYTPGMNAGVTFWVDWQEAGEIARDKGDSGMIFVCRLVFWLQVLAFSIFLFAVFSN
jgi:hypothetical protein